MPETALNIDSILKRHAKQLERIGRCWVDAQVVDGCDNASLNVVMRLRYAVTALDEALQEIESVQDGR